MQVLNKNNQPETCKALFSSEISLSDYYNVGMGP